MDVLCNEMQRCAFRTFKGKFVKHNNIFNVPFGTSKSTIASILFQPWTWTFFPKARHLTGTYTEPLGLDLANKSLEVIKSDKYMRCFPHVKIVISSASHFTNSLGGERRICTVGGKSPLGFHAHFLGCDDPIDPKGAVSQSELDNAFCFSRNLSSKIRFISLGKSRSVTEILTLTSDLLS